MPKLLVQEAASPVGQRMASPEAFGAGVGRAAQETGQVAQALGRVMTEYADGQGRASAIRFEQDLEAEAQRISLDPDIPGRSAKFDEAKRKLMSKHRPKIGGLAAFDQRAGFSAQALQTDFNHKTAVDGINETRRNTDLEVTHSMMRMARAQSTEEVGVLMLEAREALQAASNVYTPNEQTAKIQSAFGTGIRAMVDVNPKLALRVIEDFGTMLGPEVTAVYREEAITNIRQAAASVNAQRELEFKMQEREEKRRSNEAEDQLVEMDASGELSLAAVQGFKRDLSPAAWIRWSKRAKGGGSGESTAGVGDSELYMDLTDRAEAGEDITDDATAAVASGLLAPDKRNALVKTSRAKRFAGPRASIKDALDPGAFRADTTMATKRVNALQAFDEWVREHPTATIEDSTNKANELIRLGATRTRSTKQLSGKSREDILGDMRTLKQQRDAGIVSDAVYAEKAKQLRDALSEFDARQALEGVGGDGQ